MKFKFYVSCLIIIFTGSFLKAQSPSDPSTSQKDTLWKTEGNFQFLINQAAFNNDWQGGGTTNYSANVVVNYDIYYNKGKYTWDTKLLGDYGINKTKDEEFYRKTNDRLEINSTVGRQIGQSKW
jgi:hypothetical protein